MTNQKMLLDIFEIVFTSLYVFQTKLFIVLFLHFLSRNYACKKLFFLETINTNVHGTCKNSKTNTTQ